MLRIANRLAIKALIAKHAQKGGQEEPVARKRSKVQGARGVPVLNGAEARRSFELEALRQAGQILDWAYEDITLVVITAAGRTVRYTPDFTVWHLDRTVEFEEVKGFMRDSARLRLLAAVQKYPGFRWTIQWDEQKRFRREKLNWQ